MQVVTVVVASLVAAAGWILSLAGISGTWLVLMATVGLDVFYDWQWDFVASTVVAGLLSAGAEGLEFIAGLLGAKALGGSRRAQVGAFLGTLLGGVLGSVLIPVPLVGTLVGVVGGGFLGALLGELQHQKRVLAVEGEAMTAGLKAGVGVMLAKLFAIFVKASLSTLLVAWFIWVAYSHLSR